MTLLRRLSTTTAAATLALVGAGGIVRATGSGLGCPDWPRCHGRLIPPLEFHALVEYSHRVLASVVVVLVVATAWVAWRRARALPSVLWPAVAAVGVVILQAALGAVVVERELDPASGTAHFAVAMLLVAAVVVTAANARLVGAPAPPEARALRPSLWAAAAAVAGALLAGVYVRGSGASLAFLDWPLMDGRLIPDLSARAAAAAFAHRVTAVAALATPGLLAARARRAPGPIRTMAWGAFLLALAQAGLGAAAVLSRLATATVAGHVLLGSLTWATLVALAVVLARRERTPAEAAPAPARTAAAYLQLVKPDIIVLLLVTAFPAMVLAAGGIPPAGLTAATLVGGALAAGGANALNCYLDRDIDEVMARTRGRPIPSHRLEPERALRFGIGLSLVAFTWLWWAVNLLAASLALAAVVFYALVYTIWMKRSTPHNIVIGGAAGAVPVLVGWAAVTGTLEAPAWVLFAIVFFWTPPHFWALSMRYAGDYRAAGVPMLVVARGARATAQQILAYSLPLLAVSLLLYPVAAMGAIYLGAALLLGGAFLLHAVRVAREANPRAAMGLFRFSITYLGLLFAAVAVDQLARIPA